MYLRSLDMILHAGVVGSLVAAYLQVPSPDLIQEVGVVAYLLVAVILGGGGVMTWFLRRLVSSVDRMVAAHERVPDEIITLRGEVVGRLERVEIKLDRAVTLAEEHVGIARMWRETEGPGRTVRGAE